MHALRLHASAGRADGRPSLAAAVSALTVSQIGAVVKDRIALEKVLSTV